MITDAQKNNIIAKIINLKEGEAIWLKDFSIDEKLFIIKLCEDQKTGTLETNGTASDVTSQTKLRKISKPFNKIKYFEKIKI